MRTTKSKAISTFLIIAILSTLFFLHYFPIKTHTFHTEDKCRPNLLLINGAKHEAKKYRIITGEFSKFTKTKSELEKLGISNKSQAGCEYNSKTISLYLF